MLKFINPEKTVAEFNGAFFSLAAPEDWDSIGDGPTREKVKAWLAAGNVAEQLPEPSLSSIRASLATKIDDEVAGIYSRFTRFETEYSLRESQAKSFKDAGYTGTVPEQVAAFATPAGMSAQAATDLILSQAANLRTALSSLGAKRMRKYEIINAVDAAAAQAKFDEISAEIKAIGDSLS